MKITVLGCGALGQLWLSALHKCGHDVQGWLRVPKLHCVVNLIERDGDLFNKLLISNDINFLAHSDLLLVTLKAYQVSEAVNALAPILPYRSPILLLHNGMGTLDELKNVTQPIISGVTTHAVKKEKDIFVHISSNSITHIGPARKLKGDYSYLKDILNAALPNVIWHNTIKPHLWRKLAANCIINPLTALWNCPNGELRNNFQEIKILCTEISKVMKYEGIYISVEDLYTYVELIIANTSNNISSMLQDIRELKYTEIEYITGYLLKCAHIHDVNIPKNARLYELIKHKEREYIDIRNRLNTSFLLCDKRQ